MTKTVLRILTTAFSLLITTHSVSQSGAVYYFVFKVDPVLTEYEKINYDRTLFSSFSEGDAMPEELIDSIKLKTNQALSELLNMPVSMCYQQNKSGENIDSGNMDGSLPGLPGAFPFKHGKEKCPENNRYIKLYVQLYSGLSTSVTTEPDKTKTKTKIKPRLEITAKIFDENNKEITKYDAVVKDFEKLRSETRYYSGYQITKTEALSPLDIYAMYQSGLEALLKEQ